MMLIANKRFTNLLILLAIATASISQAKIKISETIERSVVLLCHTKPQSKNTLGTGFLVEPNGLVVTADHVIFNEDIGDVFEIIYAIRYTGTENRYFRVKVVHRFRDGTEGRDLALLRSTSPAEVGPPYLKVGTGTEIGNAIWITGFPLVFNEVKAYPFVRKGCVASTRFSYEGHPILVLDLQSVSGFSGSPVIDISSEKVVAVVKGPPKKRRSTSFTVATVIDCNDLLPDKRKPSNQGIAKKR